MKNLKTLSKIAVGLFIITTCCKPLVAQEDSVKPARKPVFTLRYFNQDNKVQYLQLQVQVKSGRVFEPIGKLKVNLYMDDDSNPFASVITDANGKAMAFIPSSQKEKWASGISHNFIAKTDSVPELGPLDTELEITKARLTVQAKEEDDTKNVTVLAEELKDSSWVPVPELELKIGVKRLNSMLGIGEEESYTTDENGLATVEFNLDSLPGDADGNIVLMAKVDDHETYGNLQAEKIMPWGAKLIAKTRFGERSLWATGDKVPYWLLALAGFIITMVWGTLIFLILQLFKIRSIGFRKT